MWIAAVIVLSISLLMLFLRLLFGPTIFDRLLAVNIFGTNVVMLIAILAFMKDSESYLDIALVYAFLNFVGTVGFLRYFKYKS